MNLKLPLRIRLAVAVGALLVPLSSAYAFSDTEARKAILDLRQRMEQQTNSILDMSSQIQQLRQEVATLRGRVEQLERTSDVISSQTAPRDVTVDGKTFTAKPQEIADYEAGLERLRNADYAGAATVIQNFMSRWAESGYKESAYFWLGNAQYGNRQYRDAINSFTTLVDSWPGHLRAPDALLSIANSYLALNNKSSMRAALERILKEYPQSEAANQARNQLAAM